MAEVLAVSVLDVDVEGELRRRRVKLRSRLIISAGTGPTIDAAIAYCRVVLYRARLASYPDKDATVMGCGVWWVVYE
jgi:hypothetical protein